MNFEEGNARIRVTLHESSNYHVEAEVEYPEDGYVRRATAWAPEKHLALLSAHEIAIDLDKLVMAEEIEKAYRMCLAQARMMTLAEWISKNE